jgi:ribonucleotide reductase alpha subunit
MEAIAYYAYWASTELAEERGRYSSYKGSLWDRGILPHDSLDILAEERGGYLEVDRSVTMDWDALRNRIANYGMRNSNCLAIAPTATISNIIGVDASIEPTYQNLYVKSNLSGEFTVANEHLVRDLKKMGLWDEVMIADLKYFDGSLSRIDRIPAELRNLYATAFEVEPKWLVEAGIASPEVDRPGTVAEHLHGRRIGQEARRNLQAGLAARPEDHLLPARDGRHARREVHRPRRRAERGVERSRTQVLRHRRPDLRSLPVRITRFRTPAQSITETTMLSFEDDLPISLPHPGLGLRTAEPTPMPMPMARDLPRGIDMPEPPAASTRMRRIRAEDKRVINGGTDVNQLVPFKYKWAWDKYLSGCANHWMPQEVNMQRDIELWKTPNGLTDDERRIVKRNLGFFVTADSLAANNIVLGTYRHITAPECRQYLLRQAFEEAIHTHAYQYIVEASASTKARSSTRITRVQSIRDKDEFLIPFIDVLTDPRSRPARPKPTSSC